MSPTHLICKVCGWRAQRRSAQQRYCSAKCRRRGVADSRKKGGRMIASGGGAVLVEPNWAHTSYQMDEGDAAFLGLRTDKLGGVQFKNRAQIENAQAKFASVGRRWEYDFGAFSRRR